VPYRIDVHDPPVTALDTLVDLGALDIEEGPDGLAALMPDTVIAADVAGALGVREVRVSPAIGRDDGSVWTLSLRPVVTRGLTIVPDWMPEPAGALRMADGPAFGTGLHATTALCLEALEDVVDVAPPARMLDVGTGSGILALAALHRGVPRAAGLDIDLGALRVAAANARLNALGDRLVLVCGGPGALREAWPLVIANIRAAELIELASALVRRVERGGRLVLSGIPRAVATDVEQVYRRLGIRQLSRHERDGWTLLVLVPTW
jgi:ribosomal protein L11 methyltransferase